MTSAGILALSPLCDAFVEELLSKLRVRPEEARDILAIARAWGEEPAHGADQRTLRAEIRARVLRYLAGARATFETAVIQ